jgi:hypothetical protein
VSGERFGRRGHGSSGFVSGMFGEWPVVCDRQNDSEELKVE